MSPRVETPSAGNNAPAAPPRRAVCPRCGYDLRGHVETWTDRCPINGGCSECGYAFEWANVLSPIRNRLRWLYEHARRWWDVRRAWGTFARSLAPWWFWRRVSRIPDARPARALLGFVLVCISVLCASVLLLYAMLILSSDFGTSSNMPSWSTIASYPFRTAGWSYRYINNHWYNLGVNIYTASLWSIVSSAAFAAVAVASVLASQQHIDRAVGARLAARMGVYALSIPTALFTAHVLLVLIAHAELAYANFLVDSRIRSWFGSIGVYTVAPMRGRYTEWVIMGVVAWQWWHWWAAIRSHLIFVGPRQLWACIVVGGTLAAALSSALLWWAFF